MKGYFIYDGSLNAPSNDLILLIFNSLLRDKSLLESLYNISEEEGFAKIAALIAKTKEDTISNIAFLEARRQVMFSLLYKHDNEGERASHWWPLVDTLRSSNSSIERLLAKKAIDLLVSRALWHLETENLETLALVTKEFSSGTYDKGTNARRIAHDIIEGETFLSEKLKRHPIKSETKEFLLGVNEDLSDSPKDWANAFKLIGMSNDEDRTQKKDTEEITRLINEVNRAAPL